MALEHFNWTQNIPAVGHDPSKMALATSAVSCGVILLLGLKARRSLLKKHTNDGVAEQMSFRFVFELITELIISLSDMVIGEHGRKYVPMFGALFIYILLNNFLGLLPGFTPATDNLNATLALGIFSFVVYTYLGIKEHGAKYIKQFTGHLPLALSPLLILLPLMFVIELVSHAVRPMSLGLRLMGNMTGDHTVLGIFTDILPIGLPVIFYFLGIFVCFVQAFVFTLLSMVYVSMAVAHDEH